METKIRVLIADPNEDMRMLLQDTISREGDMTVCACAADGVEALEKIAEQAPDVVVLELVMPRLDGLGVLRKLPETECDSAVVVHTGFVNTRMVAEAAELGASYFVSKPCEPAELLERAGGYRDAPARLESALESLIRSLLIQLTKSHSLMIQLPKSRSKRLRKNIQFLKLMQRLQKRDRRLPPIWRTR